MIFLLLIKFRGEFNLFIFFRYKKLLIGLILYESLIRLDEYSLALCIPDGTLIPGEKFGEEEKQNPYI